MCDVFTMNVRCSSAFWLVFLVAGSFACSRGKPHAKSPAPAGTLHETVSLQVTSSSKSSFLFNTAAFADQMATPVRASLEEHGFDLAGQDAAQHVIVHVRDAGRGAGRVRYFCEVEVFVYAGWPGQLESAKNDEQAKDGRIIEMTPVISTSLRLENKKRRTIGEGSEVREGAEFCAKGVADELATMRDEIPRSPKRRDPPSTPPPPAFETPAAKASALPQTSAFSIARKLEVGPGNLTWTPQNRLIVSLHQFFDPAFAVGEVSGDGAVSEFAAEAHLDAVLGIQCDENGVVWMLDNGMRSTQRARLVGYHSVRNKLVADINLSSVMPKNAFFNDLVIDLDHEHAYLADPAGGDNAALVVVDLRTGEARRVLEGHESVVPEEVDLVISGKPVEVDREDGTTFRPHIGVNPIAADRDNEWLYFGPMHGTSLYRVPTRVLRDGSLGRGAIGDAVQRFSDKPISDGISIDNSGNVYLGDLARNAIVKISPEGELETLAQAPELSWVDAFSFDSEGKLYAVVNQLHKSSPLNRGRDETRTPYLIVEVPTDDSGTVGR